MTHGSFFETHRLKFVMFHLILYFLWISGFSLGIPMPLFFEILHDNETDR